MACYNAGQEKGFGMTAWGGATMAETAGFETQVLVAAPEGTAQRLGEVLKMAGYALGGVCTSGAQTIEAAEKQPGAILVATHRLGDMTGAALIAQLDPLSGAILILPQGEMPEESLPESVVTMHNPLNKDAFLQTVHVLTRMSRRLERLSREIERLEQMLTERKIIDRAKGRLMDERSMSEADAHHYIQKQSMDSGKRLADVAREILGEKMAV